MRDVAFGDGTNEVGEAMFEDFREVADGLLSEKEPTMSTLLERLKQGSESAHELMQRVGGDYERWIKQDGEVQLRKCLNEVAPEYVEMIQGVINGYVDILRKADTRERDRREEMTGILEGLTGTNVWIQHRKIKLQAGREGLISTDERWMAERCKGHIKAVLDVCSGTRILSEGVLGLLASISAELGKMLQGRSVEADKRGESADKLTTNVGLWKVRKVSGKACGKLRMDRVG